MESDDLNNILSLLCPVFEAASLNDETLHKINAYLYVKGYTVTDNKLYANRKTQNISCRELFNAFQPREGFGLVFRNSLTDAGEVKLAHIVARCFTPGQNEPLLWILRSWEDLLNRRQEIEKLDWMLAKSAIDFSRDDWLVSLVYHIASAESDSKVVSTHIGLLQDMISGNESTTTSLLSSVSDFSFMEHDELGSVAVMPGASILQRSEQQHSQHHQLSTEASIVGKELGLSLGPMLTDCLKEPEIVKLAQSLRKSGHISKKLYEKVKANNANVENILVDFVKQCKGSWMKDLLKAVKRSGSSCANELQEVVSQLFSGDLNVQWLLENWEDMKENETIVVNEAEIFFENLTMDIMNSASIDWLLNIVNVASHSPHREKFVTSVKNKLSPSTSSTSPSESESESDSDHSLKVGKDPTNEYSEKTTKPVIMVKL
ncbi:uncharacterized protein LOC144745827 [Ciona intestinalis]